MEDNKTVAWIYKKRDEMIQTIIGEEFAMSSCPYDDIRNNYSKRIELLIQGKNRFCEVIDDYEKNKNQYEICYSEYMVSLYDKNNDNTDNTNNIINQNKMKLDIAKNMLDKSIRFIEYEKIAYMMYMTLSSFYNVN